MCFGSKSPTSEHIGEKLDVTVNPLVPNTAYVVTYADGHETLHQIDQVEVDDYGFETDAPLIGREFHSHADTELDSNRKMIQRLIYQAATDEEAEKAAKAKALPFGGRIDPYKHLENVPDAADLPQAKRGVPHRTNEVRQVAERALTHVEAAMQLKKSIHWTARHYQMLTQRYPDGVPESAVAALAEEWAPSTPSKKHTNGGGAC